MRHVVLFSLACLGVLSCAPRKFNAGGQTQATTDLPADARIDAIRRAEVWIAGSDALVAGRDLRKGPENKLFTEHEQAMECRFMEPDPKDPPGGRTPKFGCAFGAGDDSKILKVKYDPYFNQVGKTPGKRNLEVYGEILSTRLMWALGFPADNIYTVRATCLNCPPDPWLYLRKKSNILDAKDKAFGFVRPELLESSAWLERSNRPFHPAVVEVKYKADAIVSGQTEGWGWREMFEHMANPDVQRPQREALTILMAFINHMDNTAAQQRLVCEKSSWNGKNCGKPILMVQDAGSNFGNGWAPLQGDTRLNKVDVEKWRQLSVWKDLPKCVAHVQGAPNASFRDGWQVSDKGREFLANLMTKLSRNQIRDLFTAARIVMTGPEVSIDEWVDAFMTKMNRDILNARCGH
jgi:hypothetical protein